MQLVIAEKPSVARSIAEVIGGRLRKSNAPGDADNTETAG